MRSTTSSETPHKVRSWFGIIGRVLLLVAGSMIIASALCEAVLRMAHRYVPGETQAAPDQRKPLATPDLRHYIEKLAIAKGTDRNWFFDNPPPLPNRGVPTPQSVERARDFDRRGIFTAQSDYVWNRYYVESERCAVNGIFRNYPDDVLIFDPPRESFHPRYRFQANVTTVARLVTNEFGFRGHAISLAKPPRTVRIAFVGASTTVGFHGFAFSYPEYVEFWLNRYATANHLDVRFESINAGREGLNSEDIAAIVQDEVLPLDPDLVVYYEGSNQFRSVEMVREPVPAKPSSTDQPMEHKIPEALRKRLAIANLLDRALPGFGAFAEPPKPAYEVNWPRDVDERKPDVNSPHLPMRLPRIVRDLDAIRASLEPAGAQLVLCSFEWLAQDGMLLYPKRHEYIYKQLNDSLWPLRYADVRRFADFQNRLFRSYATSRGVPFLNVAGALPQDPNLFVDAIHMTEPGDRLKAWIVFQKLVPILRTKLDDGSLPRAAGSHVPPPPSLATAEMSTHCPDKPTGPLERLAGAVDLEAIQAAVSTAKIRYAQPVVVSSAPQQWSYAASIEINTPINITRPCYLYLRGRVTKGRIGVGVLDRQTHDIQLEKSVDPTTDLTDVYVPVLFPHRAGALLIRNLASGGPSEIEINDAAMLVFLKPLPETLVKRIALTDAQVAGPSASILKRADGIVISSPTAAYAFGARFPLGLDPNESGALSVHVWLRTLEGVSGVGVLLPGDKSFVEQRWIPTVSHSMEIILALPSPARVGDLTIFNGTASNTASKTLVERVEVRKAR